MIQIFDCPQGSTEWHECRRGIPTASEFKSVLAKGEGKTRKTYMLKLLGERISGQVAEGFSNVHTDRGHAQEDEARRHYIFHCDADPVQVGFIRNGDKGCSPDSLVGDDGLLEIKTKLPHLQCEVLLADKCPTDHYAQVQGQIWVTEREWCDFCSYSPGLPLFVKRVHRDEKYIAELDKAVQIFLDELNELHEQIKRRYAA